jgi:hypothetical protein
MGALTLLDGGDHDRDIDPRLVWGGNLTIRRDVFYEVRGSHPDYIPSPWEAYQGDGEVGLTVKVGAAGYRAAYSPDCAVLHAVPAERMEVDYLERRAWFVGLHTSFTDARRECGLTASEGVADQPPVARRRLSERVRGRVRRTARTLSADEPQAGSLASTARSQAEDVRCRMRQAREAGYLWHRERLGSSPALLAYVSRTDYLGADAVLPAAAGVVR